MIDEFENQNGPLLPHHLSVLHEISNKVKEGNSSENSYDLQTLRVQDAYLVFNDNGLLMMRVLQE